MMLRYLLALSFLLPGSTSLSGAQLSLDGLYSLPSLIGTAPKRPVWSGDGGKLAFLWNDRGYPARDLWIVDLGLEPPAPMRVTNHASEAEGDRGIVDVVWNPDGERLVYELEATLRILRVGEASEVVAAGGATAAAYSSSGDLAFLRDGDLWVLEPVGEPRRLLGDARGEVRVVSYRWSRDGRHIAVLESDERRVPLRGIPNYMSTDVEMASVRRPFPGEEPRSLRLGVVTVADASVTWLDLEAKATESIFSYRWSPNGRRLLVDRSDLYVKSRRILLVDARGGGVSELYREDDALNVTAYWQAEWAPDGRGIYFLSDRDDDYHIYYLAASDGGGEPRRITSGDFAVAHFTVNEDGVHYVANVPRPEDRHLFRIGLEGGEPEQRTERAGTHDTVISPDGRFAADMFSSDRMPPELFLVSDAGEHRLTQSPRPEFYEHAWVPAQYVTFPSHVDGVTLHGRMLLPPELSDGRKYPVIVGSVYSNTVRNQWGGRNAHPLWGLEQYLLQQGYILFVVDIRGSWGHGRELRRGIRLDYGGIDVEDIHSGVKYLETLDYADTSRVGIWGSSYGGLLTCMSLFKKPGIYKAGVAGAPATNVFHALTGEMRVMMSPWDEPAAYESASAFSHAAGLRDPLLIIHGMRDRIVLYKDSLALVERLMELGKNVDLVTLPSSRHGWDREDLYQTRFAFKKLVEYFDRYVKGVGP